MPKNQVSDLITDQEIAFALLILSGTMTDRRAAEAVGLNPVSAHTCSSTVPPRSNGSSSRKQTDCVSRTCGVNKSWTASGKSPTCPPK
jgi:hypothetical protein